MRPLRILIARLRALFGGRAVDADLNEQLSTHLEEAAEEFESQGLSRQEAMRAARRSFGGVMQAQEAHRSIRSFPWLEDALRDVRYALRALVRAPGFAAVAIGTMALAIGAATALFSVIDAALLRPVPYPRPEELVSLTVGDGDSREMAMAPSAADIESWRTNTSVFVHVGMGRENALGPLVVDAGTPERVIAGTASEEFLEVFGVTPLLGRAFTIDDRRPQAPAVVLIGHRYWQQRFNGSPDVLGRSMRVDGATATIVGVVPPGFYPDTIIWRPHVVTTPAYAIRGSGTPVFGRLRRGVTIESAIHELTALLVSTRDQPNPLAQVRSLYDETTEDYGRTVAVLSAAVVLILLIASVNVAGLLLARGATREPELAIRKSIGASRGRLIRQLLAESAVLAVGAAIVGVLLAWMLLDAIVALVPLRLPDNVFPAINIQVLVFAVALSVLTAFGFGLAPALNSSSADARTFASAGRLRHGSVVTRRGGQLLIAVEVALALVLVTGAALMLRSFSKMLAIDVGFEPAGIRTIQVTPVERDPATLRAYYATLLERVRAIPGLVAVGAADRPPLDGSGFFTGADVNGRSIGVNYRNVMSGYFEALGLPLLLGRLPAGADFTANPSFVVLSETAARELFPDQSPIGQQFIASRRSLTVIGVVGDALHRTPLRDERDDAPQVYFGSQPNPRNFFGAALTIIVRPAAPIPDLEEQLRRAMQASPEPVFIEPMRSGRDWYGEQIAEPRQRTLLLSALGGLGLSLTLIGIFATTAYAVARRTREVGIRIALGARPGQMVLAIVRDTAWPVALGIVLGLAGAVAATRVIASFLFETTPTDPLTLATTVVALAVTALSAAWIPARRAARVDPVAALRAE